MDVDEDDVDQQESVSIACCHVTVLVHSSTAERACCSKPLPDCLLTCPRCVYTLALLGVAKNSSEDEDIDEDDDNGIFSTEWELTVARKKVASRNIAFLPLASLS